jgi:hypothetical protein
LGEPLAEVGEFTAKYQPCDKLRVNDQEETGGTFHEVCLVLPPDTNLNGATRTAIPRRNPRDPTRPRGSFRVVG